MVFKNGDQKRDGLIEYVFAPFYVENELENKTVYAARDIFCGINRRQCWSKKKKKNWYYEWFGYMARFEIYVERRM